MSNEPDWPPRASAANYREGECQQGSTGQRWQVRGGQWVRLTPPREVPRGYGPTPWTCSVCGHENPMSLQSCDNCRRHPRTTLTDGTQVYPAHREIDPATGMQRGYIVLSEEERAKGFVRPVRRSYKHWKCGVVTTMGQSLAETYARNPQFYSGTFCCGCGKHFPVGTDGEFVWDGSTEKVGT